MRMKVRLTMMGRICESGLSGQSHVGSKCLKQTYLFETEKGLLPCGSERGHDGQGSEVDRETVRRWSTDRRRAQGGALSGNREGSVAREGSERRRKGDGGDGWRQEGNDVGRKRRSEKGMEGLGGEMRKGSSEKATREERDEGRGRPRRRGLLTPCKQASFVRTDADASK